MEILVFSNLCSYLLFKYLSALKMNALVHVVQNPHHKCDWETRLCVYTHLNSDALIWDFTSMFSSNVQLFKGPIYVGATCGWNGLASGCTDDIAMGLSVSCLHCYSHTFKDNLNLWVCRRCTLYSVENLFCKHIYTFWWMSSVSMVAFLNPFDIFQPHF